MKPFKIFEGGELNIIKSSDMICNEVSNDDNDVDGKMNKKEISLKIKRHKELHNEICLKNTKCYFGIISGGFQNVINILLKT